MPQEKDREREKSSLFSCACAREYLHCLAARIVVFLLEFALVYSTLVKADQSHHDLQVIYSRF